MLKAYKEQQGREQNVGLLKAPVMANSLFLKKPARIEALGLVLLLALLLWRLMERRRRAQVHPTGRTSTGWAPQETDRPPAFMLVPKCSGVIVLKGGPQRRLAPPLSAVHRGYLVALGVSAACFTSPGSGQQRAWQEASPPR